MIIRSYEVIQPDAGPVGAALREMARADPFRAERLVGALEDFVQRDTQFSFRVMPEAEGEIEIFMEPPRWVLMHMPDAAALVRVDHGKRTIELIHLVEDYGGSGEPAQWSEAQRWAYAALMSGRP
jgi:hypothetical protein